MFYKKAELFLSILSIFRRTEYFGRNGRAFWLIAFEYIEKEKLLDHKTLESNMYWIKWSNFPEVVGRKYRQVLFDCITHFKLDPVKSSTLANIIK